MDLRKVLLAEHSRAQAVKIAAYVGDNPKRFKELLGIYLAGPYRITQRAAWPLGICVERHPALVSPHLKSILDFLKTPGVHDAVKRNTVRMLQFIPILPRKYYGDITVLCFDYLQTTRIPVAVKVFSMSVLARIAQDEPDLKRELRIVIEDLLPFHTAAFAARAKKVLKQL